MLRQDSWPVTDQRPRAPTPSLRRTSLKFRFLFLPRKNQHSQSLMWSKSLSVRNSSSLVATKFNDRKKNSTRSSRQCWEFSLQQPEEHDRCRAVQFGCVIRIFALASNNPVLHSRLRTPAHEYFLRPGAARKCHSSLCHFPPQSKPCQFTSRSSVNHNVSCYCYEPL